MDELEEELEGLKAILMNDVSIERLVNDCEPRVRIDFRLDSCKMTVEFEESSYHSKVPEIEVAVLADELHHLDTSALKQHLIKTAMRELANLYLYLLYQAAQEWVQDNKVAAKSIDTSMASVPVCRYFLEGRCKFNEKCHNLHPSSAGCSNTSTGAKSDQPFPKCQDVPKVGKSDQDDSDATEKEKKSRMRTATDVISRIQWDPELSEDDFVLGYSDRFLGIIEKSFADFFWEDISTVGQDTLAIPKHRIQYFKYKSVIVWDRRVQVDNFFGSRGEGTTIHDLIRKHKELS